MEYILLRDQIKNFIGQSKVIAACFFSYNFDSDFFENYLLPLFVPDAPFSDNKIQNAILWRKFNYLLPKIAVVCDFNGKGSEAPNLDYDVFTREMKISGKHKPVFHCKQSYLLTNDDRLIVINGSNNLTYSGWCKNIEGITIEYFQNGHYFPRTYKDQYLGFIKFMCREYPNTSSLEAIKSFFYKQKYTDEVTTCYWDSGMFPFVDFLKYKINESIEEIEVFSPFVYGEQNLEYLEGFCSNISFCIPFEGTNVVGVGKDIYNKFHSRGIKWSLLNQKDETKEFRFNHSKIYRFKGSESFFTVIGSVNFTEMAWKGVMHGGNYENAVFYIEPIDDWKPFLTVYDGNAEDEFRFIEKTENDKKEVQLNSPDLSFTIDWQKDILQFTNKESFECKWVICSSNRKITVGTGEFNLTSDQREELSKNPAIHVIYNGNTFIYYPRQIGMDFKPLPANLNLKNEQIFKLWNELLKSKNPVIDVLYLESLLREKTGETGDWVDEQKQESILNHMSAHLSGIIQLEKALFPKIIQKNLIHYYLVVDNIDTIWGYLKCLKKEVDEEKLQKGFAWLVMEIIRIHLFERAVKFNIEVELHEILKLKLEAWKNELKMLRKKGFDLDEKLLKWTLKQL
jgi:hypothetical protein